MNEEDVVRPALLSAVTQEEADAMVVGVFHRVAGSAMNYTEFEQAVFAVWAGCPLEAAEPEELRALPILVVSAAIDKLVGR